MWMATAIALALYKPPSTGARVAPNESSPQRPGNNSSPASRTIESGSAETTGTATSPLSSSGQTLAAPNATDAPSTNLANEDAEAASSATENAAEEDRE